MSKDRSSDEADARTVFEAANPRLVKAREQLIAGLTPACELFDETEPESDDELDAINDGDDADVEDDA